jgi:SsrA-binding protein
MSQEGKPARGGRNLTVNRKASHDYTILEKLEAGIELLGTEVKVVRNGEAGLAGAYAKVEKGQLFLQQLSIPPYEFGNRFNHDTLRTRRLLVHRKEVRKLQALQEQKGLTLIPLRLYLTPRGIVKVELAVCRGKDQEDRRETIKRRESDRDAARAIASHGHR